MTTVFTEPIFDTTVAWQKLVLLFLIKQLTSLHSRNITLKQMADDIGAEACYF